jgi:hypothetical protein
LKRSTGVKPCGGKATKLSSGTAPRLESKLHIGTYLPGEQVCSNEQEEDDRQLLKDDRETVAAGFTAPRMVGIDTSRKWA